MFYYGIPIPQKTLKVKTIQQGKKQVAKVLSKIGWTTISFLYMASSHELLLLYDLCDTPCWSSRA